MSASELRILHAIHDFLPRHRAGSELYAAALCKELQRDHEVMVLAAEYDPARRHGEIFRRELDGLPIFELVNNWTFESLAESYSSPLLAHSIERVLEETKPDVVHVHNLLNLSFELPRLAHVRGAAVVATLHDYTLVCPSGGQRIHRAEQHVCHEIEPERCARCFRQSPQYSQMAFGRTALSGPTARTIGRLARLARSLAPRGVDRLRAALRQIEGPAIELGDIVRRLEAARALFVDIDRFVAPSPSIAVEFRRLGVPEERIEVRDYGFAPLARVATAGSTAELRIGFIGSIVWHKGVHILTDAVRRLPATGWTLAVHGDLGVEPSYSASLRESARGLPVRFPGGFVASEAARIYAELDLLVVPSLWLENSPLVVHEAFQAGVPVIASNIGGLADLVIDRAYGRLVAPNSSEELAAVLLEALESRERVRAWAENLPAVRTIEEDARAWVTSYSATLDPSGARNSIGRSNL